MEQQEQEEQPRKEWKGCVLVCITEDVNGGDAQVDVLDGDYHTVNDAKQWMDDNASSGHYSIQNYQKIIILEGSRIVQMYERRPYNYGSWQRWYDED